MLVQGVRLFVFRGPSIKSERLFFFYFSPLPRNSAQLLEGPGKDHSDPFSALTLPFGQTRVSRETFP